VLFNNAPNDAQPLSLAGFQKILQLGSQENQQVEKVPAWCMAKTTPAAPLKKKERGGKKLSQRCVAVQPPHSNMDANTQQFPNLSVTSSLLMVTGMPTPLASALVHGQNHPSSPSKGM